MDDLSSSIRRIIAQDVYPLLSGSAAADAGRPRTGDGMDGGSDANAMPSNALGSGYAFAPVREVGGAGRATDPSPSAAPSAAGLPHPHGTLWACDPDLMADPYATSLSGVQRSQRAAAGSDAAGGDRRACRQTRPKRLRTHPALPPAHPPDAAPPEAVVPVAGSVLPTGLAFASREPDPAPLEPKTSSRRAKANDVLADLVRDLVREWLRERMPELLEAELQREVSRLKNAR